MMPRHKLVLALLAFFGFVSRAEAQRAVSRVPDDDARLYSHLLAMTDTRTLDTALIDRSLASGWRPLRAAAALAIGQVGAERGIAGAPRLRALLSDPDRTVGANAAYALGLLKDSASIAALSAAVAGNGEVAREAAWSLGEIGAPARSAITAALQRSHDPGGSIQLLLAAAKMRPIPIANVRQYLHDRDPSVVWAATYSIARNRAPAGVRDLLDLEGSGVARGAQSAAGLATTTVPPYGDARSAPALIRAEIARGIASSGAGDSLRARAFATLARLATDTDPRVRINALRSLGTYRAPAETLLVRATHDPDPNVRVAAAQSLATTPLAGNAFPTLWAADTSVVYRSSLLASATRAGLRPPQLAEWAASRDWHLRAAVASAAGDTLDRAFAISRASQFLADPDPRVREAAYGALAPTGSMALEDTVHAMLVKGLRDRDFYVRATVLGALTDRPSPVDLDPVLASYRLAASDSANDARLAAIQYIAALWKKDSVAVSAASRSRLAALPIPSDPLERDAGKSVATWSSWSAVAATPRASGWYDSLVRDLIIPAYQGKTPVATIYTVRGPIRLQLFAAEAPITVWNFLSLARYHGMELSLSGAVWILQEHALSSRRPELRRAGWRSER
jgi:HEAT repeat protein